MMLWIILSGFFGVVLGFTLAACLAVSQREDERALVSKVVSRETPRMYRFGARDIPDEVDTDGRTISDADPGL